MLSADDARMPDAVIPSTGLPFLQVSALSVKTAPLSGAEYYLFMIFNHLLARSYIDNSQSSNNL